MFGRNYLKRLEDCLIHLLSNTSTNLFEDMLKAHIQRSQQSVRCPEHQLPTPSSDKNIIQYAAGYVPMKLMKYEKQSLDVAAEYFECLNSMAINGDESSLQAYTLEWSKKVNRGGLFEVNDETFRFFREIEIKMQWHLMEVLRQVPIEGQKQLIIDTVASEENMQFLWALISCDIRQEEHAIILLKDIIDLWLTSWFFSCCSVVRRAQTENKIQHT